ncbi:hypothetical protein, conserved [Eimeria acervulina]|uniref:Uncharacterized protein n=1 Tax=Eimeria acervulina TaxID=5801 RepID=U6GP57_EIMAC|nr:hypothetical protein, conserved [Eimeria acervulina]CDI81362.1 hypothetical protein, conserved [Eimeria acervulina]
MDTPGYGGALRGPPGAPGAPRSFSCSQCCECLTPVRCVVDQHEVEIIPSSARSSSSCSSSRSNNGYSGRGAISSPDSTVRTARFSSSSSCLRQQRHSDGVATAAAAAAAPAAAAATTTARGVIRPAALLLGAPLSSAAPLGPPGGAPLTNRSAATSEIYTEISSRQISADAAAPKVPLINLQQMQNHRAAAPESPISSSERLLHIHSSNCTTPTAATSAAAAAAAATAAAEAGRNCRSSSSSSSSSGAVSRPSGLGVSSFSLLEKETVQEEEKLSLSRLTTVSVSFRDENTSIDSQTNPSSAACSRSSSLLHLPILCSETEQRQAQPTRGNSSSIYCSNNSSNSSSSSSSSSGGFCGNEDDLFSDSFSGVSAHSQCMQPQPGVLLSVHLGQRLSPEKLIHKETTILSTAPPSAVCCSACFAADSFPLFGGDMACDCGEAKGLLLLSTKETAAAAAAAAAGAWGPLQPPEASAEALKRLTDSAAVAAAASTQRAAAGLL